MEIQYNVRFKDELNLSLKYMYFRNCVLRKNDGYNINCIKLNVEIR